MQLSRWITTGILGILMLAAASHAAPTFCPEHFTGGQAPDLTNQKLAARTQDICYSGFALKHSGITRTSLYSAEHLTRDHLAQAKGLKRNSRFHPDPNLPASERAELRHYARSGYDRGHVAPSADMPDKNSQQECFSLANMVPQDPNNNRGVWEGIESTVRMLARERGDLYVISGPIYGGDTILRIGGAVMVPTQLYKAVYDPVRREAGAYLVDNAAGAQPVMISIAELEKITGISLFPAVSAGIKARAM